MSEHNTASPWIRACRVDELADEQARRLDTTPPVSVFRTNGEFFCVDDTCTHEDFSLAEGWVEDCSVECPLHLAKFCLRTGAALSTPAYRPLRTHEVRVDGDDLYVRIEQRQPDDPACPSTTGGLDGMA